MTTLVIMILFNYPHRPVDMVFTPTEVYGTVNQCDQRLRSALNEAQSRHPEAIVRGACVPTRAAPE